MYFLFVRHVKAKVLAGSGSLGQLSGLTVSQLCQFLPDLKQLKQVNLPPSLKASAKRKGLRFCLRFGD